MPELIRLNKAIADAGFCSRRKADELIFAGKVIINGEKEINPARKVDKALDKIFINNQELKFETDFCYLLLNKPVQVVSTVSDPEGRPTVMDYIPTALKQRRLYPVGRLDYFSEGLILLTDDGELANYLMHPSNDQLRIYEVLVREEVSQEMIRLMAKGMTLAEGEKLAPVQAKILDSEHHRGSLLEFALSQGVNRQIRRMCRDLNLTILRLKRVAHGNINIMGLKSGECRLLKPEEVKNLQAKR